MAKSATQVILNGVLNIRSNMLKKYNKAEEIKRTAQELYEKNGRKVTPKIEKHLQKYNMLQREVRAHDALYNTNPLDYVLNKDQYKKFNVHKETKAAMRRQSKP